MSALRIDFCESSLFFNSDKHEVMFRTAFEPQDRLFLTRIDRFRDEVTQLMIHERKRYHDASYGSYEKTRRFAMVSGLQRTQNSIQSMIAEQEQLMK